MLALNIFQFHTRRAQGIISASRRLGSSVVKANVVSIAADYGEKQVHGEEELRK